MSYQDFFSDSLVKKLEESERAGGVVLANCHHGDLVIVETINSRYFIAIEDQPGNAVIQGGDIVRPTRAFINGSTFGGSIIKKDWIGISMHLEFWNIEQKECVITSVIQSVIIEENSDTAADMILAAYMKG